MKKPILKLALPVILVPILLILLPAPLDGAYWDSFGSSPGPGPWWGPAVYERRSVGEEPGAPPDVARIRLHVRPRKSDLLVDGTDLGQARDYRADYHPLWLSPGEHELELSHPGYQTLRVRLDAQKGQIEDLHYHLNSGEGIDPRSSGSSSTGARSGGKLATS